MERLRAASWAWNGRLLAMALAACGGKVDRAVDERNELPALGDVCTANAENIPDFTGFTTTEISIETDSPACDTGVCVVHGFQGRVGCPYGQDVGEATCRTSDGKPVIGAVEPQLVGRPPSIASICSCRCGGPGPRPFCDCPSDMECINLVDDVGGSGPSVPGYCVPKGSANVDVSDDACEASRANCEDRAVSD